MSNQPDAWRMPPGGAWRLRMGELRELIDSAETEGDREALEDEYEVARLNSETLDRDAEVARQEAADVEAESS